MPVIEISCYDVWREISNYLDDEVTPELRQRMEAHFKVCEHCTAILDGTRNVVKIVAGGEVFDVPSGFGDRLRRRIQDRSREITSGD